MSTMLNIHTDIETKLKYFHDVGKIPNIIFHGPHGSGKKTILNNFIRLIYNNDNDKIKSYVMYVNCAYGKGIKFIREELKFFAKTNIPTNSGHNFKCVILFNSDKLTTDAQSALRRCIELYNHTTRFFIVVEDKYKLLRPILSRFCEIYVSCPYVNGKKINLYKYNIEQTFILKHYKTNRNEWIKKELTKPSFTIKDILTLSTKLYEKGYSAIDIISLVEEEQINLPIINNVNRYELLMAFQIVKSDIKNEKLLMYFVLYFIFIEKSISLTNIITT